MFPVVGELNVCVKRSLRGNEPLVAALPRSVWQESEVEILIAKLNKTEFSEVIGIADFGKISEKFQAFEISSRHHQITVPAVPGFCERRY